MRPYTLCAVMLAGAGLVLGQVDAARAQCALPYQITNGQTADASQVMANFNALLTCLNGTVNTGNAGQVGYYATTGKSISGQSLSALLDSSISSASGSILYRGSSAWSALAPGTPGQVLQTQGASSAPVWATAGGGGSRGLFTGAMSIEKPTISFLGYSTPLNVGSATETDGVQGVLYYGPSQGVSSFHGWIKPAPTPPYTISILVLPDAVDLDTVFYIGWYDGTNKLDLAGQETSGALGTRTRHDTFSTPTSLASYADFGTRVFNWLQIEDDGTTIYIRDSQDGEMWDTVYSVAKSSGYLGASGYTNIAIGINNASKTRTWDLVSYSEQ